MLTPNDVQQEVEDILELRRQQGRLYTLRAERKERALFQRVLEEIAEGSIDPRSLAIAALEVKRP